MASATFNAAVGDRAMLRKQGSRLWLDGKIIAVSEPSRVTVHAGHLVMERMDPDECRTDASGWRMVVIPPPAEIAAADPRGRLRRFARKHKLAIARVPWPHLDSLRQYQLADPHADYQPLVIRVIRQETAILRYCDKQFSHLTFAEEDTKVMLVQPTGRGERILEFPAGFEPDTTL